MNKQLFGDHPVHLKNYSIDMRENVALLFQWSSSALSSKNTVKDTELQQADSGSDFHYRRKPATEESHLKTKQTEQI